LLQGLGVCCPFGGAGIGTEGDGGQGGKIAATGPLGQTFLDPHRCCVEDSRLVRCNIRAIKQRGFRACLHGRRDLEPSCRVAGEDVDRIDFNASGLVGAEGISDELSVAIFQPQHPEFGIGRALRRQGLLDGGLLGDTGIHEEQIMSPGRGRLGQAGIACRQGVDKLGAAAVVMTGVWHRGMTGVAVARIALVHDRHNCCGVEQYTRLQRQQGLFRAEKSRGLRAFRSGLHGGVVPDKWLNA